MQAIAARYPGSTLQLLEDPPGPPSRITILAEIYGPDPHKVNVIAAMVRKEFESIYDMAEVTDTIPADISAPGDCRPRQGGAFGCQPGFRRRCPANPVWRRRNWPRASCERAESGADPADGATSLCGFSRANGHRLVTGNMRLIPAEVSTIDTYRLLWDGEMRLTLDAFRDMTGALTVAISFVYLLLVAYYRSFFIPLIAMAAIPAAFVGVFPAHWLTGTWFSMASMIGLVALAGIVVRSSLLVIDFIRDNEALGMPLREAALEAGVVRLRPVMLTTLAIILGSAVIYTDPMFTGMAVSLMAGTAMSTILTIFVALTLYYRYASKRKARGKTY